MNGSWRSRNVAGFTARSRPAFATAILGQAITGTRALSPEATVAGTVAFAANIVTVGAGLLAGVRTLAGAWTALRSRPAS